MAWGIHASSAAPVRRLDTDDNLRWCADRSRPQRQAAASAVSSCPMRGIGRAHLLGNVRGRRGRDRSRELDGCRIVS